MSMLDAASSRQSPTLLNQPPTWVAMIPLRNSPRRRHPRHVYQNDHGDALHSAMAGYAAGVSGTVVGYPLDSAKVWIQTGGCQNKYMILASTSDASNLSPKSRPFHKMVQTIRALYSGVSGPLVTVGMVQSLNFVIYDRTRSVLHHGNEQYGNKQFDTPGSVKEASTSATYLTHDSLTGVAIAGLVSGMSVACITAPLIMIKTNQQITGNSFREALHGTLYRQGRFSLSIGAAGFLPHILGESLGRSIYYLSYEGLKRSWTASKTRSHVTESECSISLQERMVCAALSGVACWSAVFPLDSLRNRLYAASTNRQFESQALATGGSSRRLMFDTIRQMQMERSFYRGFWVTVLRAGPVAATVLPVYDLTLEYLSSGR